MAKRGRKPTPYTGGAWAVGGIVPKARPRSLPDLEARRGVIVARYLPHAVARAEQTGDRIYAGLVAYYRRELVSLTDAILAQRRTQPGAGEAVRDPLATVGAGLPAYGVS